MFGMPVALLGLVVGIVLFVILGVTVASWWVAAISGLGALLIISLVGAFGQWKSEGSVYS